MINGRRLNENISPNQRRLRLKELSGVELTEKEKNILKRKVSDGVVPMKNTSKYHDRITTPPSPIDDPTELDDEIDLDEIIKELMWEGGVYDEFDDEELEINGLTKKELKEMIYQVLNDM